jgi:hypothetical protein
MKSKNKELIYIVFCFILLSCGNNNRKSQFSISNNGDTIIYYGVVEKEKPNAPKFQFEEISYNFGDITQGEQVNHTFHFKNVGKSNLIIYDIATTCGCTTSAYSKDPIKPEESGYIEVTFDSKHKNGDVISNVLISANTYPAQIILTINAKVITYK